MPACPRALRPRPPSRRWPAAPRTTRRVEDGVPAGFVSLEFRQPFFTLTPQGWIPDLIVTEGARGRRIGAALLDAAFEEALRRRVYAVALESGHQRAVAHRLYLAAGMADVGLFAWLER